MKALSDLQKFLQEVWREVDPRRGKVTWPTLKSIRVSTIVVMLSSVVLAIYISLCDYLLKGVFVMMRPDV